MANIKLNKVLTIFILSLCSNLILGCQLNTKPTTTYSQNLKIISDKENKRPIKTKMTNKLNIIGSKQVKITTTLVKSCGAFLSVKPKSCQSSLNHSFSFALIHALTQKKYAVTSNKDGTLIEELPLGRYSITSSMLFSVSPNHIEITQESNKFQLTFHAKLR